MNLKSDLIQVKHSIDELIGEEARTLHWGTPQSACEYRYTGPVERYLWILGDAIGYEKSRITGETAWEFLQDMKTGKRMQDLGPTYDDALDHIADILITIGKDKREMIDARAHAHRMLMQINKQDVLSLIDTYVGIGNLDEASLAKGDIIRARDLYTYLGKERNRLYNVLHYPPARTVGTYVRDALRFLKGLFSQD